MHPTAIPQPTIDRVMARRGRVHAFEAIDPARSALVVIDMQNGFCAAGSAAEIPVAREIVPNINRLAGAMRAAGGIVAWVQMTVPTKEDWPVFMDTLVSAEFGDHMLSDLRPDGDGNKLWPALQTETSDLFVTKNRFSAFLPSACELPDLLRQKDIDTVLIVGTLTNVCCESSARDAAMLDFKTIMISDGNACRTDADHIASLSTFLLVFGDVYTTDEMIEVIRKSSSEQKSVAAE